MFRTGPQKLMHSKWLLAALILIGLAFFEGRLNQKTLADIREPSSTSLTR